MINSRHSQHCNHFDVMSPLMRAAAVKFCVLDIYEWAQVNPRILECMYVENHHKFIIPSKLKPSPPPFKHRHVPKQEVWTQCRPNGTSLCTQWPCRHGYFHLRQIVHGLLLLLLPYNNVPKSDIAIHIQGVTFVPQNIWEGKFQEGFYYIRNFWQQYDS